MLPFQYNFSFTEDHLNDVSGHLELDSPVAYQTQDQATAFYRPGKLFLEDCGNLEILLYHNSSTERFIYLRDAPIDRNLIDLMGLSENDTKGLNSIPLSGQLCLGAERVGLIGRALRDLTASPILYQTIESRKQHNLAIFPIAREGLKYQVAETIFQNYGYYCDEIVLDAHHVFDSSVPIYNRKVEMTLFKDKDLDKRQKENISVAFIADSIASGLVMKEVIAKVKERFDQIQQIEVIAPLATIRGLCRVASVKCVQDIKVRVHVFETLLNALPPDFYYSAHYNIPEMHIRPDLEVAYRAWWGEDNGGKMIADTACAGYGWSEVFFSPRKQIEMINGELESRHQMKIGDIVKRNLR
jgi:hypothetical protein